MEESNNVYSLEDLIQKNQVQFKKKQKAYLKIKRAGDFVASLLAITVLSPVFLGVYAAVKIESPKEKAIFKQKRLGKDLKPFCLYKFRSMKTGSPELGTSEFADADQYITKVGSFLRKTSLDELPQLICCLQGTMSLVGPRPLLGREEEMHFLRNYYGVYKVRPGITGLAQINGRDEMGNYDKVRWDRTYVRNISMQLDLKILLSTVGKVLHRDGVVDGGKQVMVKSIAADQPLKKDDYNRTVEIYDQAMRGGRAKF